MTIGSAAAKSAHAFFKWGTMFKWGAMLKWGAMFTWGAMFKWGATFKWGTNSQGHTFNRVGSEQSVCDRLCHYDMYQNIIGCGLQQVHAKS